jgi:hypothetical protein
MAIPFQCHSCGGQFAAPDQLAGKKAKCQRCGTVVQVPHAAPGASEGELAARAFSMAMAGQPVGGTHAAQADLFGSAGMPPGMPANPLTPMGANPYGQAANPYGQQAGGAYLQPAVGAGGGGGMPWGWILGGGAALIVLAGLIGVVVTISSMLSRPDPVPGPVAANLPNNVQPNNNQPAPNPVVPQPANNPFEQQAAGNPGAPQPGENPFTPAAANPFEQTGPTPAPSSTPATVSTPAASGENPFTNAEQVALPDRPRELPKGGEDIENPFGDQAVVNEPATAAPATTEANMSVPAGWSPPIRPPCRSNTRRARSRFPSPTGPSCACRTARATSCSVRSTISRPTRSRCSISAPARQLARR